MLRCELLAIAWYAVLVSCSPALEPTTSSEVELPTASAPSKADEVPPRWSLPSCPLRYEILTREVMRDEFNKEPNEALSFLTLEATATPSGMALQLESKGWLKRGKHLPFAVPDRDYPALSLATDGSSWSSAQASFLLTGLGSQGGLAWLFPSLPQRGKGEWRFQVDQRMLNMSGVRLPSSRDLKALPPDEAVSFVLAQEVVRREDGGWLIRSSGPERWSSKTDPNSPPHFAALERAGSVRAEHVLLPNGRVLRAKLEREVDLKLTMGEAGRQLKVLQHSEAHLVAACDGPTEPTLAPKLTREERAIAAAGDLGFALLSEAAPGTVSNMFSQELRRLHGEQTLLETLARFRKTFPEKQPWWPLPLYLPNDEDVVASDKSVQLHQSLSVPVSSKSQAHADFVLTLVEEGGRTVVAEVTVQLSEPEPNQPTKALLEISRRRLFP